MNTLTRLITIICVVNIFMYLAVNFSISAEGGHQLNRDYKFYFEGDMIDTYLSSRDDIDNMIRDSKGNWTNYGADINSEFTGVPQQYGGEGASLGTDAFSFLDPLRIVWSFGITVLNFAVAPLTLFFNFRMPIFIGLIIGIPYFLMIVFSIFAFIRGVGD